MLRCLWLFLFSFLFLNPTANGQLGAGTTRYQWTGRVNNTGGIFRDTIQYTFYPNGIYVCERINSPDKKGIWRLENELIVLDWDKTGEDYIYKSALKLKKSSLKWIIDPEAVTYMGWLRYWWFSWKKALKYKKAI